MKLVLVMKLLKDAMKRARTDEVHWALSDRVLLKYYSVTPDFWKNEILHLSEFSIWSFNSPQ